MRRKDGLWYFRGLPYPHSQLCSAGGVARGEAVSLVERLTYSIAEAAEALGMSPRSVYNLIHREGFPTLKVGGRRLISRELLAEWVQERAGGQKEAAPGAANIQGGGVEQTLSGTVSASKYIR